MSFAMKSIFSLCFIFTCLPVFSQKVEKTPVYGSVGFSAGNFFGGNAGLNFIFNQKFSLQAEYSSSIRKSKSIPEDYTIGMVDIFSMGTTTPKDKIQSFRLMFGLVKKSEQSGFFRFNFKTGISVATISTPVNWEKVDYFLLAANYTWDTESMTRLGWVIKPDFEFLFTNFIGVVVSPYCELNSDYSSAGVGVGLLLGRIE